MFESYKNRMAHRGSNTSEMLRMQSNMVVEQTWYQDPNYRRVYVVVANRGLPQVAEWHEPIDAKFNVDTYQRVDSDEPAYHVQFRHGAEKLNPGIAIGSYVYIQDEDGEWKWWLIVGLDERPSFRQYHIVECNWQFGWVVDGKIYYHLGVWRSGGSTREVDENAYTTTVNGKGVIWMPTNETSQTIGHGQRFLISDKGRIPPLCFSVSNIIDTMPVGITKFVMSQSTFDNVHDYADLMLANYYDSEIAPVESSEETKINTFVIAHNGTKPSVKVGGSEKVFTAQLDEDNQSDIQWSLFDGKQIYDCSHDNNTWTFGDYTITTTDRVMKLKVASNYNLIGAVLTVKAKCADGSVGELQVEVIG